MSLVFALIATATAVPTASSPALVPLNKAHPAVMNKIILPFETSPSNEFADIANLEAAFQTKFEKNVEKLDMKKTVSRIPWPSSYWPTYQDGINYRWNSSGLTPVEKYAKAFNLNAVNLADTISATSGVDSQTYLPKCTETDSGCEDGFCAIREGKKEGHCIPTWFGICHAWAPAAILEPEPMCAVTGPNGVVFEPFDLKGLMSQLYDGSNIGTVFSGMRCNLANPTRDSFGRYSNKECRDLSASFFHIATTNLIGKLDKSFVADVTATAEVWNQPVRGYEILKKEPISKADAMKKYFTSSNSTTYTFNTKADSLVFVRTRFLYIVESNDNRSGLEDEYTTSKTYEYLLELDAQKNIIGGEWVGYSRLDHPDFFWLATETPKSANVGGIKYAEVKKLVEKSAKATC